MDNGTYVVFEGMNGSGKSTLAKAVATTLAKTRETNLIAFPSRATPIGNLIRDVISGSVDVDQHAMMWLFVAEGVARDKQIAQWLADGTNVICDRHTQFSGLFYQTQIHGIAATLAVTEHAHMRLPDFLYIIDVPPEVALKRCSVHTDDGAPTDMYESDDLEAVTRERDAYRIDITNYVKRNASHVKRGTSVLTGKQCKVTVLDGTQPLQESIKTILSDIA